MAIKSSKRQWEKNNSQIWRKSESLQYWRYLLSYPAQPHWTPLHLCQNTCFCKAGHLMSQKAQICSVYTLIPSSADLFQWCWWQSKAFILAGSEQMLAGDCKQRAESVFLPTDNPGTIHLSFHPYNHPVDEWMESYPRFCQVKTGWHQGQVATER